MIGMADRNEDDLNQFSRKGMPDLLEAAFKGTNEAYAEAARPTADIVLPAVSEHTIGQLLQMLMLATVVEGRLMGINPTASRAWSVQAEHDATSRRRRTCPRAKSATPPRACEPPPSFQGIRT